MTTLPSATPRGKALARDLAKLNVQVSCEPPDLWAMSRDCWPRSLLWTKAGVTPHPPDVVAWPRDVEQVAEIVKFAAERQVAVVPFGAGSGVVGGTVPLRGGIALDLKHLTGPLAIDLDERTAEVGAGMNGQRFEELLNAQGATLGHFPSSIYCSTVGGWLAARSAGQLSSRYGKIEDMVLSLEAVDGTGAILHTLDGPSGGPDLTQLLVGSEGTLGVITSSRLRIWPKPKKQWLRGVKFPSVQDGMRAIQSLMRSGLRPAVARLYDPLDTILAGRSGGAAMQVPQPLKWVVEGAQAEALRLALKAPMLLNRLVDALPAAALLILGFEGDSDFELDEEGEAALALCQAERGDDLGPSPGERWLANRYKISYRQSPLFSAGAFVDTMEVATTWDRLDGLYHGVRRAVQNLAFVLAHFSHAYLEGCSIYFTFIGLAGAPAEEIGRGSRDDAELDLEEAESRYDACWKAALGAVADAGATLSHHHGVGLSKQIFLPREHGEGMRQLRALKKAFDPHGILNPGKLLL
ncbi:MAG: FAD-binding oxidoreductase [Myxococcales bacterium]